MDAYFGPSGVLTGSARAAQTSREKAEALSGRQEAAQLKREVERKRAALERRISVLRADHETEAAELRRIAEQAGTRTLVLGNERAASGRLRQADAKMAVGPWGNIFCDSTWRERRPDRAKRSGASINCAKRN